MKFRKVPIGLTLPPCNQRLLKMSDVSVIETCTHGHNKKGAMFLDDHLLLFVLQGTYTIYHGNEEYIVQENEMVLLKKAIGVTYLKQGNPGKENLMEYMLFFIKDDFIGDFIKQHQLEKDMQAPRVPVSVKDVNPVLRAFVNSVKPYFDRIDEVEQGLLRLKMLELLYNIASQDTDLLHQLVQLRQITTVNIADVMEENFLNPVNNEDLAYLSGRSVSAFKRDFSAIYNTSPAKWIRQRRLQKAQELLINTNMLVKDICYTTGFGNPAHFTRLFKKHFGYQPTVERANISIDQVQNAKVAS